MCRKPKAARGVAAMGVAYVSRSLKSLPRAPSTKLTKAEALPPHGVSYIEWSADGLLVVARNEAHPRCLWVWSAMEAKLAALLVQLENVTCARWRPCGTVLAYCCNTPRVYFWTASGPSWSDLPALSTPDGTMAPGNVSGIKWSPDGKKLVLMSKDQFRTCDVSFEETVNISDTDEGQIDETL